MSTSGFVSLRNRTVIVRPVKARDLYGLNFSAEKQVESLATLIARVTDLSAKEIEELSVDDFSRLAEKVNSYMSKS